MTMVFLPLAPLYASTAEEEISKSMASVVQECSGYAGVLTKAKWSTYKVKAETRGISIPNSYRESLYRVQLAQCVTVKNIEILEMVKEMTPVKDWIKIGGNDTLTKLHADLLKTI